MVTGRKGFTLVELLVVTLLGSLLVLATYEVLITNQRTYTVQAAQVGNQQKARATLDVLFAELREISASGGDILGMGADTLRVRAMRRYGLVCDVSWGSGAAFYLKARKVGDWFSVGDSVFVFADNQTTTSSDDVWIQARISARDTTATCGSAGAQRLTFVDSAFVRDTVRVGAPVRSFTSYKYGILTWGNEQYLGRQSQGGYAIPMVGPLEVSDGDGRKGVRFRYVDSLNAVTTDPLAVRQIQVTVRTWSDVTTNQGRRVADSLTATIYPRN